MARSRKRPSSPPFPPETRAPSVEPCNRSPRILPTTSSAFQTEPCEPLKLRPPPRLHFSSSRLLTFFAITPTMATPPQYASQPPSSMAKTTEPNRNKKYDPKKPHITEEPITRANWYKHVNWLNVTLIVGVPIYGLIAAYWTPLQWKTAVWAVAYYFMTGLGITAGKFTRRKSFTSCPNISRRLPPTLGPHIVLRNHSSQDFPRRRWRWCR